MSKPTSNNCVLTAEIELENQELCGEIELENQELCGEIEPNNILEVFIESGARGKSAYEVWIDEGGTGNTLVNNKFDESDDTQALPEQSNTEKRTARFVVGTSTSGWTAADCDYLCDGTADDVEINNAITALPKLVVKL